MSDIATLTVQVREAGVPRRLRREGGVPANLYGREVSNISLSIDDLDLTRLMAAGGHRGLLKLQFTGENLPSGDALRTVMVRDIQRDPLSGRVLHLDFYQVDLKAKLTTEVPVRLLGEEVATKGEGVLQHGLRMIEVECLPTDIPDYLEVDISELEIGDSVTVADLGAPEGVDILTDLGEIIVTVVVPRMEIEEPETDEEEVEGEEAEGEATADDEEERQED